MSRAVGEVLGDVQGGDGVDGVLGWTGGVPETNKEVEFATCL